MRQYLMIRGIDFQSIEELHEYLARELCFPAYYGKNLSALYDVLTDYSDELTICMDLRDMEDDDLYQELIRVQEVAADAARENPLLEFETPEDEE